MRHFAPFQASVRVTNEPLWSMALPTVQTSSSWGTAATLFKKLAGPLAPGTLGLGTICHEEPFQCSKRVARPPLVAGKLVPPLTQTLLWETAVTPSRKEPGDPAGLRPLTACHEEPSQCSTSGWFVFVLS